MTPNVDTSNALDLPLSLPLARICWLLAALILWLSLSLGFDAIVVFNDATMPQQPADLKTATFRINHVSSRTPNFNVQFSDGKTAWLSFPDRLGGNPKGGLKMPQITDHARVQLKGCMATAKIRSVLSSFGRETQVWELACPQAHIYYGPDVAASEIKAHPTFDLVVSMICAAFLFCGGYLAAMVARTLGKQSDVQRGAGSDRELTASPQDEAVSESQT